MTLKERAAQLKFQIPAVFLALKDAETPWYAKALAGITAAYALSPVDLVPDFIPVLGYLDDVILLPGLVALTVKCVPKAVWERCLENAHGLWIDGKPQKWYYAVPIIVIWLLLLIGIVKAIF